MAARNRMVAATRIDFDAASLTVNYQEMNVTGLSTDAQIFKMLNNSNVGVDVSYDGIEPNDFIVPGGSFVLDFTANAQEERAAFVKGQKIWLKAASAGAGTIYATGYSQRRQ